MTMKKILAAVAATAIAGSAMATMAFAADVIDFENGSYAGIEMHLDDGADPSVLSIVDFNGSKALKVDVQDVANVPKVKFLVANLVNADAVADIAKIEFDLTVEAKDGVTPPGWMGGAVGSAGTDNQNPAWSDQAWEGGEYEAAVSQTMVVSKTLLPIPTERFSVGDAGAHFLLMRWATEVPYNMYIDNVKFYDNDGNAMEVTVPDAPAVDAPSTDAPAAGGDTSAPAGGANTGVAPVAALAVATLAGAALVASKKR